MQENPLKGTPRGETAQGMQKEGMREASCAESWSRETGGGMQCRRGAWSIDQYMYV